MMRGSDSTTAISSSRPPIVAGPMLRNFRFFRALSNAGCASAPGAKQKSDNPPAARRRVRVAEFIGLSRSVPFYTAAAPDVAGRTIVSGRLGDRAVEPTPVATPGSDPLAWPAV